MLLFPGSGVNLSSMAGQSWKPFLLVGGSGWFHSPSQMKAAPQCSQKHIGMDWKAYPPKNMSKANPPKNILKANPPKNILKANPPKHILKANPPKKH